MTARKIIQRLLGCPIVFTEQASVKVDKVASFSFDNLCHSDTGWVLPVFHGRLSAVLSMLCGNNIVARGAAPTLCKSALPGYTSPIAPHARYGFGSPVRNRRTTAAVRYFFVHRMASLLWAGCAGAASAAPVPIPGLPTLYSSAHPVWKRGDRTLNRIGVIAMAHKARIPSSATALDTSPELINAYQLNGIDNKLDDIYQFVRYISKQVFRNAIKRELCAGLKLASLLDLPAKDVTVVMQWLERLRNDAISNYVATSALEQRFLNQWLEESRAADGYFPDLKSENSDVIKQQVAA